MDQALNAIANPVRRQMLRLVLGTERTPSDIANRLGLTRPATSQHLRVLREAGLVDVRAARGHRYYATREEQIQALRRFLEGFWGSRLNAMKAAAERKHGRAREEM